MGRRRTVILWARLEIFTQRPESNDEGCARKMCSAFVNDLDNKSGADRDDVGKLF